MAKTTLRSLFLLTIITGSIFTLTACGNENDEPVKSVVPLQTTSIPQNAKIEVAPVTKPAPDSIPSNPIKRALDPTPKTEVKVTTKYIDGTYTQDGLYSTPGGETSIKVSVTLKDDTVKSLSVIAGADGGTMRQYQDLFIAGVNSAVVGQKLDSINVDAINGASLTAIGFNQAMDQARASAQK